MVSTFLEQYAKLNIAQREAVETIDGPVMVVAGPGTGKTQILALRIANILQKTDIKPDGILCLTFTNSAVDEMKKRLVRYIGESGNEVQIFTFHSFGMLIIKKHFKTLGFTEAPKLLEDTDITIFFDTVLRAHEWEYLRPRGDSARYVSDLRSLISLLKRERISGAMFLDEIEKEIQVLEDDENNLSTRGESKGQLKKEVSKRIEGLERTKEVVRFINLYELAKKEQHVLDYDDVLEYLVKIVEDSTDALAEIREKYLYVLIDEHQDSSRVQNEFLARVWAGVERPDIFVVGDDRQLIYGFSGASIDHFKGFKKNFPDAKLIPLIENYRSTQVILDVSHALLKSVLSDTELKSQSRENHPVRLVEAKTTEEEIRAAGLDIQEKIKKGLNPNHCAILVPKNRQVKKALEILHSMGLPVVAGEALHLFDQEEVTQFLRVLKIIENGDVPSLSLSFFDKFSGIEPLEAHRFLSAENMKEFSFLSVKEGKHPTLFGDNAHVMNWIERLSEWQEEYKKNNSLSIIEIVGKELFVENKINEEKIVSLREILATISALLAKEIEKNHNLGLLEFISYLENLEEYGEHVPLLAEPKEGIKVLTMHSSKGLEFEYVWIAHMDERSLSGGKKGGFAIPASIAEKTEERDVDAVKRKLYVAITRAKRFCTLSYALGDGEVEQKVGSVIADLPPEIFQKEKAVMVKKQSKQSFRGTSLKELSKLVAQKYTDRYVSVSLLNNFFECPWKWYFRNLLQIPEDTNENLEFGSIVHDAVDKILKMNHAPNAKELEEMISNKEALRIVSRWVKNRLPQIKLHRENEQPISIHDEKFPRLKIFGKIDLLEFLDPENLRVTDFKTGGVRKKSEIEKMDEEGRMSNYLRQLAMYSYLIEKSPKWKASARESRLEFLEAKDPKESLYDRVITLNEIELLVQDIVDYDSFVKSGEWLNRPCNYNSYGKNTECEYCKRAQRF